MNFKLLYLPFYVLSLCLLSCKKKQDLSTLLGVDKKIEFDHAKVIRDVKNNYEIKIGDHWKRELYFDDYQSRIYAADTTRNYSNSFIIDVTRFKGKIILEDAFRNELKSKIEKKARNYIISEGYSKYKDLPAYYIFSFKKQSEQEIYTLDYYIAEEDSYYLLKSTINTSKNLSNSLSESLAIFNSITFL
ncbi:hypothetical protein ACXGQW_01495 [Wenyingzhuangia sp. IMCC45533]